MGTSAGNKIALTFQQIHFKEQRKFANKFSSGKKSGGLSKILLGSALLLPVVLGCSLSKGNKSTTDVLNQQYGGDERS